MITIETAVMAILVLILVMCLILYWMLHILNMKWFGVQLRNVIENINSLKKIINYGKY